MDYEALSQHPQKNGAELVAPPQPPQHPCLAALEMLEIAVPLTHVRRQPARSLKSVAWAQVCPSRGAVAPAHDARNETASIELREFALASVIHAAPGR